MIIYYRKSFYTTVLERVIFNGPLTLHENTFNLIQHLVKIGIMEKKYTLGSTGRIITIAEPFRINNFLDRVSSLVYSPNFYLF